MEMGYMTDEIEHLDKEISKQSPEGNSYWLLIWKHK